MPSHCSASVRSRVPALPTPVPYEYQPTAVQALDAGHETPLRTLLLPAGKVLWVVQLVPSHRSANGALGVLEEEHPSPHVGNPTAIQALPLEHDTAAKLLANAGVGWTAQVVPFQRSAIACSEQQMPWFRT